MGAERGHSGRPGRTVVSQQRPDQSSANLPPPLPAGALERENNRLRPVAQGPRRGSRVKEPKVAKGPVVCIEGIIGAGKTTLCTEAQEKCNLRIVAEPVEDNPYLERYYSNPVRYGLPMQMWLATRRFHLQSIAAAELTDGSNGTIVDRSILGDRAFAMALRSQGLIDPEFWPVYDEFFQAMARHVRPPECMIFLDVEPEVALARIAARGRDFEKNGVSLTYLQKLREAYNAMVDDVASQRYAWCQGISVHRFSWSADNQSTDSILQIIDRHCRTFGEE